MIAGEPEPHSIVPTKFDSAAAKAVPPLDAEGMPASEVTIAETLRPAGYHTIHFGKWHLGAVKGLRPEDQGFDESLGFMAGASMFLPEHDKGVENSKQPWDPIDRFLWPNLPWMVQYNGSKPFAPRGYMTDYLADEAVTAIHANRNRPFFIYFAPNAIHTPLQATKADYDALPQIKDHRLRVYGAMVRNLDRNVGRILAALKAEGLDKNTLVIFTSDNGGAGYIGLPEINKPYRGWKATFFEGGIHSPFFMRYPGVIPAGARFDAPVAHVDIFATAAGVAGAPVPEDRVIDGVNLLPFVTGQAKGRPHQSLYWRSGRYEVVMDGDWKLQNSKAQGRVWLHDLAHDPTEQHDLSAARPDKVRDLLALLKTYDSQMAKPLWPSVLEGPVFIDHPSGQPQRPGQDYIFWDN
jgi:arylsulfatase A-like enzyme